jgi:tRNA modification GTPase
MGKADVILAVLDASRGDDEEMHKPLKSVPKEKGILIWNKIDIAKKEPLPSFGYAHVATVSSTTFQGIEELTNTIEELVLGGSFSQKSEIMITNVRHKAALERAFNALQKVISGIESSLSPEFVAIEMREALLSLGEIIGTNITEDILNAIFSKFCIGK